MSKSKKAIIVTLICVIITLLVTLGVFYFVFPTDTVTFLKAAWNFLNKPLPIVGVSLLMIFFFVWRMFAVSSYGKKQISEFQRRTDAISDQFKMLLKDYENRLESQRELISIYEQKLKRIEDFTLYICELSRNDRIKKLGKSYIEKLEGENHVNESKEETNDQARTD